MAEPLHLIRVTQAGITLVRVLTDDEVMAYRAALDHLREFHKSPTYLELVARNEVEFHAEMTVWAGSAQRLHRDEGFRAHQEVEVNRRLINYLSSARLLLDHYESRLKRRYGRDSAQAMALQQDTAASYDTHFEYRFLYRLRNFAQHFGVPAGHAEISGRLKTPGGAEMEYEARLLLDLHDLLQRGGDMWGPLRDEMAARDPYLDVAPFLPVMTRELNRVVSASQRAERQALLVTAQLVAEIMADAIGADQTPGIGIVEEQSPKIKVSFLQPPFRLMQWLGVAGFERPL